MVNVDLYKEISKELLDKKVTLVAVSKTKSVEEILELYNLGQRDFGENYVQELVDKFKQLPKDIRWHFIGHLQSNKVKLIAPFVHLIQSVDSEKLLKEINKEAINNNRIIDCLLQIHIAKEETKFGLNVEELQSVITEFFQKDPTNEETKKSFQNVCVKGFMGMASLTNDLEIVKKEFQSLKSLYDQYAQLPIGNWQLAILSMGMSGDYKIAIEEGSNMVRIGSLLFGKRNYKTV